MDKKNKKYIIRVSDLKFKDIENECTRKCVIYLLFSFRGENGIIQLVRKNNFECVGRFPLFVVLRDIH